MLGTGVRDHLFKAARVSVRIGCVDLSLRIGGVCVECVSVVCVGLCVSSDATTCT